MNPSASTRLASLARHFLFSTSAKPSYKFLHGSHMIPHPAKAHKGGEDAMFASDHVLVVADGVGGWAEHGVDPGLYSKKLCSIIGDKIAANKQKYINDPKLLLREAVKENKEMGSTTVIMLHLNPDTGLIKVYYLGDSVYALFSEEGIRVAQDQQKSFNFPYQVGSTGDSPNDGVLHELKADEILNETIVVASDGLWDNYPLEEMHGDVMKSQKGDLNELAKTIASKSYRCSLLDEYESPFYKKALEQGIRYYKEGKPDDITVVTARVVKEEL